MSPLLVIRGLQNLNLCLAFEEECAQSNCKLDPMVRSLRSLLKDLTKPHIKVNSGDLSIMLEHNVMLRRMLSSDWRNTHVHD